MKEKSKLYVWVGIVLLSLYVIQDLAGWKWEYLYNIQQDEMVKRWTGLGLSVFILIQWSLTLTRVVKKWRKKSLLFVDIHHWMGALSPIVFYIHAIETGFAYLALLSITFLTNVGLGLINLDVVKSKAEWVFQGWMITHVALSTAISLLMFYHIYVVFYYE